VLIRIILMLVLTCLCSGCPQVREAVKRPLAGEGEVYLFAEPFPQDAVRLEFVVSGVSAIREDGMSIPLNTEFSRFSPAENARHRLFARGALPPGRYTAISVTVKSASLLGEEGKGSLLVPDKAYESRAEFTIKRDKAVVVNLQLNYRESLTAGISFRPAFKSALPPAPLTELSGYVTNLGDNTITVFDRRTARVGAVIETGRGPTGIALDQLRLKAYVALSGEDVLAVLDVKDNEFVDRVRLMAGDEPHFVALTPDCSLAITANKGSNTASIIDVRQLIELARIPVGVGPEYVLVERNGKRAYVFNRISGSISIIDLTSRQVAATLTTESDPVFGQFNRKGDLLYVFHGMSPNLLTFSLETLSQTRRINVGMGTSALKSNTSTDRLYVGNNFGGTIGIFDPFSLMPIDFIRDDGAVRYLTIDGEENNLLALHPRSRQIRLINLISKRERGVVDTGLAPYSLVLFGER